MKKVFVGLLFMLIFQISQAQISVGVKTLFLYIPSLDFVDEGVLIDRGIYEGKIKWEIFMEAKIIKSFYLEVGALKQDYSIGFLTALNVNSGIDIQGDKGFLSYQLP